MEILYIVLALAVITTCCVICVLTVILARFVLGSNLYRPDTKPALTERTEEKKAIAELTEEQKREIRKREIEMQNFFNYNGDPMEKPEDQLNK